MNCKLFFYFQINFWNVFPRLHVLSSEIIHTNFISISIKYMTSEGQMHERPKDVFRTSIE